VIDTADREAFFNVNSEADLRAAAAMLPDRKFRNC
jgi:molybdopterin-guanine dinucleotide biosynthesis protein A